MKPLTRKETVALRAHFQLGVPLQRLNLSPATRVIFARIESVYFMWLQNPDLDLHATLYQMDCMIYGGRGRAFANSKREELLVQWVIDNVTELHPSFEVRTTIRKKRVEPTLPVEASEPKQVIEKPKAEKPKAESPKVVRSKPVRLKPSPKPFYMNRPTDPDIFARVVWDCIRPSWFASLSRTDVSVFLSWQADGPGALTAKSAADIVRALNLVRRELLCSNICACHNADAVRMLTYLHEYNLDLTAVARTFFDEDFIAFDPKKRAAIRQYNLYYSNLDLVLNRQLPAYLRSLANALTENYRLNVAESPRFYAFQNKVTKKVV